MCAGHGLFCRMMAGSYVMQSAAVSDMRHPTWDFSGSFEGTKKSVVWNGVCRCGFGRCVSVSVCVCCARLFVCNRACVCARARVMGLRIWLCGRCYVGLRRACCSVCVCVCVCVCMCAMGV